MRSRIFGSVNSSLEFHDVFRGKGIVDVDVETFGGIEAFVVCSLFSVRDKFSPKRKL